MKLNMQNEFKTVGEVQVLDGAQKARDEVFEGKVKSRNLARDGA